MLKIENLSVRFGGKGVPDAVTDISLEVKKGEKVVLLGETGSGKSVLLLAVLRMLPEAAHISGRVLLNETDLMTLSEEKMNQVRGKEISYVPQGSGNGMNPLLRVGFQVGEPLMIHQGFSVHQAVEKAIVTMKRFDLKNEEKLAGEYPHMLSGGMRQRAMISMGVVENAPVLLADEPTKGLDSRRIDQVADAFLKLQEQAILCVTHDIRFAGRIAGKVAVLYASQQVEYASHDDFFRNPLHPYSQALLAALPENGLHADMGFAPPRENREEAGACHFYSRCPYRSGECRKTPPLFSVAGGRKVRCWKYAS